MASLEKIPVFDVTNENVEELFPFIKTSISQSYFISLDCELSGLGIRKKLSAQNIEDRYQNISTVAKTRSIISLGLSCFKKNSHHSNYVSFEVTTFNLITLCSEDYIVEPGALKFLIDHNFDFNKQYSKGIKYYRGDDKVNETSDEICYIRDIFGDIVRNKKPIVLHNGLLDLIFLYQNFYAHLPKSLDSFIADLTEMFPLGIYDTKYISEYVTRDKASYLSYLFRKSQISNENNSKKKQPHIRLVLSNGKEDNQSHIEFRKCALSKTVPSFSVEVCESYMFHGHCSDGKQCLQSHDMDVICHRIETLNKRKRDSESTIETNSLNNSLKKSTTKNDVESLFEGHRAGFDAFMTGFVFAVQLSLHSDLIKNSCELEKTDFNSKLLGTKNLENKVYLVSKIKPCLIEKSQFSKYSIGHAKKKILLNY